MRSIGAVYVKVYAAMLRGSPIRGGAARIAPCKAARGWAASRDEAVLAAAKQRQELNLGLSALVSGAKLTTRPKAASFKHLRLVSYVRAEARGHESGQTQAPRLTARRSPPACAFAFSAVVHH
jgi:hypothetical protein